MASAISTPDEDVVDRLKKTMDPDVMSERERAVQERVRAQYDRAQKHLMELIDENSTLPVTISDIKVHGLRNTRNTFMESVFSRALSADKQSTYTLKTALQELQRTTDALHKFDIFHPTISMYLDQATAPGPDGRVPLTANISVQERGRFQLKTGTELGSHEGGGYINGTWRNVFGGAETLHASASTATSTVNVGTKSKSAYDATFSTPLLANPDLVLAVTGFAAEKNNHYYASHTESLRGARAALKFLSTRGEHELLYTGVHRQISNLSDSASLSVRNDAGDTVKSSITHTFTVDTRDNKLLPLSGHLFRNTTEIAGFGGLGGDVAFAKNEVETQTALSLPHGCSVSAGLRLGAMVPLPTGFGEGSQGPRNSRINDRFFLGGSTDIRGFREFGMGPRDGNDAVGGDLYYAGGVSLFAPLPRLGAESPFRFQAFLNGGRLVALEDVSATKDVRGAVGRAVGEVLGGTPSAAAGVGLVYAHPVARFELNFAVPVVVREEERGRKGLQFGVGMSFL